MKKLKRGFSLLLVVVCALSVPTTAQNINVELSKLQMATKLISTFYVDTVNTSEAVENAIVGMLEGLDPHSKYISSDEVKAMNEPLVGSFEGIGVQFNILKDTLLVVSPIPGGPSEKVGIRAGDRIVSVDGEQIAGVGIKNSDVFKMLRGDKGTEVVMEILRKGVDGRLKFTVVRGKIPIYSVDAKYMVSPEVGYIKINRFAATTYDEFLESLTELTTSGAENLILDLRGNGGGYLRSAIQIVDEFLGDKQLIVYTEGVANRKREHLASSKGFFKNGKLVVLIDEGSASASEIVTGAIQDWDRGVVIGRRSFGKGLVQRPFNLPDGSMIRLTVAQYYTPSGRCIQKPYSEGAKAYRNEVSIRYRQGELMHADSISFDESEKYNTIVNGRTVYGGGGIMPDIFIPIDTTHYSPFFRNVLGSGMLNRFVLEYVDNNRNRLLEKYSSFQKFNEKYSGQKKVFGALLEKYIKEEGDVLDGDIERSQEIICRQIRGLVARSLWTSSEYFQVVNSHEAGVLKAMELFEKDEDFAEFLH